MKTLFTGALLTAALMCSANVYANPGKGGGADKDPDACSNPNRSLTLDKMYDVTDSTKSNLLNLAPHYGNCYGLYNDPQSAYGIFSGGDNLGRLNEGLLNGEGGYFDPLLAGLITTSQLMDLDGNGSVTDPGWISLFSYEFKGGLGAPDADGYRFTSGTNGYFDITNKPLDPNEPKETRNISEFLKFGFSCGGDDGTDCSTFNWTLITDKDIVKDVQDFLGNRSTFDMLTFVFKIGNEWAIYNLDFNRIFKDELTNPDTPSNITAPFETAFGFQGTFSSAAEFDGKNISHFGVFARDPIQTTTTTIPAPATIAIMGLGLLVIRLFRRR